METVTMRDSKQTIMDAYEAANAKIKELEAKVLNPTATVAAAKKEAVLTSAAKVIGMEVLNPSIVEGYNTVMEAINMKQAELKTLYGIEAEATSLVALINAQTTRVESFDELMAEKKAELNQELEALKETISTTRDAYNQEMRDLKAAISMERKREAEEFDYNLKRSRKIDADKWADEKATREKEIADQEDNVATRGAEVALREEKMDTLEAKIATIPELIATATAEGMAKGKTEADRSNAFEVRAIKASAEADKAVLNSKIEFLTANNDRLTAEVVDLKEKLDAAYGKIQETANKSLESAGSAKMVENMKSMISDNNNRK